MRSLLIVVALAAPAYADKTVPAKSGAAMCVLSADDFKAAGVGRAAKPKANVSDEASVYCVYDGKSSATGGVELDVFFPAGAPDAEVKEAEKSALGESGGGSLADVKLAGADSARWTGNAKSGGPEFALISVRRGKLLFLLGVPKHKDAQTQLTKLATLVLARLAK
jgi:hypothetical protein